MYFRNHGFLKMLILICLNEEILKFHKLLIWERLIEVILCHWIANLVGFAEVSEKMGENFHFMDLGTKN